MNKKLFEKGKIVSICYDHISGLLGEALLKFFLKEKLIEINDSEYKITDKGWEELEIIGIDIEKLRSNGRKMVNVCMESYHGILYEHIGSSLGTMILQRMLELGWINKKDEFNYELTGLGLSGLESLGIIFKT